MKQLAPPAKSFVAIEVKGLPEQAGIYVDGQLMEDNPIAIEKSQAPVLLVVKKEDREILRKYIVPQDNTTILLETAQLDDSKFKKPVKKSLKQSKATGSDVEPLPPLDKPQIGPTETEEKAKTKIFKVFPE